jgi:energy-coupling factor transporter ATP-binding protein EcfA2
MSATSPPLRLAAIQLCGYRGFPNPVTIRLADQGRDGKPKGKGRNLLLYGENGSGKSSLGKALRDFLNFRSDAVAFDDFGYRFTITPRADRGLKLYFDNSSVDTLEWNPTTRPTGDRNFTDMARACGWMDYRIIRRISEAEGDFVEVFKPLVEAILTDCLPGSGTQTFGDLWEAVVRKASAQPTKAQATKHALEELVNDLQRFNSLLEAFLSKLERKTNELLAKFDPFGGIKLEWKEKASYNPSPTLKSLVPGKTLLRMLDRKGVLLPTPSEFLNEARLTAVGLCLYLAGLSQSIPPKRADGSTYPRLLVLDDVLLSLDMVHRLPLLKLLQTDGFEGWQIFLLTHDRAWYEIAKQQLNGWAYQELFTQRVGDYDQPVVREDHDHLMLAIDFLHDGYVKAAAVHVRTKFELVLKWACQELGLAVKYHPDSRKVPASDLWAAVSGATWKDIPPIGRATDSRGKFLWWQPEPIERSVVPNLLKVRLTHALSWVMNPLSHSQSVDHYSPEIEDAIFAVNDLEQAVRKAVAVHHAGPLVLREMLVSLINTKTVS